MATEKLSPGSLPAKFKPKRAAIYARVSTQVNGKSSTKGTRGKAAALIGWDDSNARSEISGRVSGR